MPQHEVRSYDYVNHPYARVRDAFKDDPVGILRAATRAAADRTRSLAAELRVTVAGVEIGAEIDVTIGEITETTGPYGAPTTHVPIAWRAAHRPGLFPLMNAELTIYALTATETQLDFLGRYDPPLGIVGDAMNALVGHRLAEASVHRLISGIAHYLRDELTPPR